MAIPTPEVANSRNICEAERLAELGWVSRRDARSAIAAAQQRSREGVLGDALEILREQGLLQPDMVSALDRDEAAPAPPLWRRWGPRPFGPFACYGAPAKRLYDAVCGGVNVSLSQMTRAEIELFRRLELGDDHRVTLFAALRVHRFCGSGPLLKLTTTFVERGIDVPDEVLHEMITRAAATATRDTLFRTLFATLPVERLVNVASWVVNAAPHEPFPLVGPWMSEVHGDLLAPIAPLVDRWLALPGWREPILEVARSGHVRAVSEGREAAHPLANAVPLLAAALRAGDHAAAFTLAEIGSTASIDALEQLMADAKPRLRMAVALCLVERGNTEAVATLNALLDLPSVRRHLRAHLDGAFATQHPVAAAQLRRPTDEELQQDSVLRSLLPNEPDEPAAIATLGSVEQLVYGRSALVYLFTITRTNGESFRAYEIVTYSDRPPFPGESGQVGIISAWARETELEALATLAIGHVPAPLG